MAKGSRPSSGGGGGRFSVTTVMTDSGEEIDLQGVPLVYGEKDSAITPAQRQALEKQETKRLKAKVEYSAIYDQDGNIIGQETKGGRGSVRTPLRYFQEDATLTHNHPREAGVLGGTFSDADVNTLVSTKISTIRASAKEGTYSMTKGSNFDGAGLKAYLRSETSKNEASYSSRNKTLRERVRSGSISYDDYYKSAKDSFNQFLIAEHNSLLAGQKQFGYTYTLEGR